ncbi:SDR family oxidoreductase [Amycolatopsis sp. cmx-4-68]|uniref:SDR family oxidoreductase n=1 Tax=Amycolatopsis sp. cmx-4-68 TaxID=2790938 RepID=UPI00397E414B
MADPDGCPPTDTARINQLIPLGRAGTPEDVAGAAVFLASDLAAYLNGHSPGVDAGALRI